jgi:DNA (cytosine-5)-methyltransferase 1
MSEQRSLIAAPRPRLLDLFCGAGGASKGYHDAGFEVIGVDIKPQPHYPFTFIQADALEFLRPYVTAEGMRRYFGAIHASPPCQRYSDLAYRNGNAHKHPDLIGPVRKLLEQIDQPYVIENVEGAPLIDPFMVCGTQRGLGVGEYRLRRHRLFESNVLSGLGWPGCACATDPRPVIDISGGGPSHAPRLDGAGGRTYKGTADEAREAMGIPWMTKAELNEAIPPAYTRFIGDYLIQHALVEVVA